MIGMLIVIFAVTSGLGVSFDLFTPEQWINFILNALMLLIYVFMILMPNAYLNEEIMWQMKRLLKI